jgi:hypothetical protein
MSRRADPDSMRIRLGAHRPGEVAPDLCSLARGAADGLSCRSMRKLVVFFAAVLVVPACISDEAIRAVALTTAPPGRACELLVEGLEGRGSDRDEAAWDLRKRAARAGANYVVPQASGEGWDPVAAQITPWTFGSVVTLTGDAFHCPNRATGEQATR